MKLVDVYTSDDAAKVLFELCKERREENTVNISFKMPTWDEHVDFISGVPFAYWELIDHENKYHGYVSLTWQNEIGIILFKDSRGKGLGKQALEKFMTEHKPLPEQPSRRRGCWLANIHPENERSRRLFEGCGFKHIQNTFAHES